MTTEFAGGKLIVEPVAVGEYEWITAEDRQTAATLHSSARRCQWLTWRNIVRRELGRCSLCYSPAGAPLLVEPVGTIRHISVSHTRNSVAVILTEGRCGVDIESVGRNFERVAARYITDNEEALLSPVGADWRTLVWCAKEALYKFGLRSGVDFLHDTLITGATPETQTLSAEFFGRRVPEMHYVRLDDEIVCYISE